MDAEHYLTEREQAQAAYQRRLLAWALSRTECSRCHGKGYIIQRSKFMDEGNHPTDRRAIFCERCSRSGYVQIADPDQVIKYIPAYERARDTLPAETNGRLERAVLLCAAGAVTIHDDGSVTVGSQADPTKIYRVNGRCECKDAQYGAPQINGRPGCKHQLAAWLVVRQNQSDDLEEAYGC